MIANDLSRRYCRGAPLTTVKPADGFTLVELLVVIAIIALLVSILLPALSRAREQARISVCSSNQRQLSVALHLYAEDYDEHLPGTPGYRADSLNYYYQDASDLFHLDRYCEEPDVYYCPSSEYQADTPVGDGTYFLWFNAYGHWARFIGYSCYVSVRKYDGIYETIPTRISDPASWVVWSDRDFLLALDGKYWTSNHPGDYGAYPERPPKTSGRWGTNVATLDGAVEWRPESSTQNRYPAFNYAGSGPVTWWARF